MGLTKYLFRNKNRFFVITICFISLWGIFGVFLIISEESDIRYITYFKTTVREHNMSPLTNYLLEVHRNAYSGKSRFTSVLGPLGAGGTGNHHMGIANMILYSIFTNSTMLIPAKSYFFDQENTFIDYFPFRSLELENYILHPSDDKRITNIVDKMSQNCAKSWFFRTSSMSKLDHVIDTVSNQYIYRHVNYVVPEVGVYREEGDPHVYIRGCDDDICQEFFMNKETRKKVFHDPHHITSTGANVGCFPTYQYFYWIFHVFRSQEKMEFLCYELELCDGISLSFVDENCRENACQEVGLLLMRNIFKSLFQINELKAIKLLRKYSVYSDDPSYTKIGVHVRTIMAGFGSEEGVEKVGKCIAKVMNYMNKNDFKTGNSFRIFLAGDNQFKVTRFFLSRLKEILNEEKSETRYGDLLFNEIEFDYHDMGEKSIHGFWVDDDDGTKKKKMNEDPHSSQIQLFLDIFSLTRSDVLIMTQYSSFAALVGSFNRGIENHRFFLFPLAGEDFSPQPDEVLEEFMPCSNKIPFQPCPKEICPHEYL